MGLFTLNNIPHLLLPMCPSASVLPVQPRAHMGRCSLCEAVIKPCLWNGALRVGLCCILADAAARLCVGTCGKRSRTQGCGCYTASINTGDPVMLQSCGPQSEPVCCNMTSTKLSGKLSVHPNTHVWEVNGWDFVRRFCANRLRSTFSQHCSFQCAKREAVSGK